VNFKEQVETDFDSALINTEEFGYTCNWNGYPLKIVKGVEELEKNEAQGVNVHRLRVICKSEDLQTAPQPYEEVKFDGQPWYIYDVQTPLAHYIIILERRVAA